MKAKYRIRATPYSMFNYELQKRTLFRTWRHVAWSDSKGYLEGLLADITKPVSDVYDAQGNKL